MFGVHYLALRCHIYDDRAFGYGSRGEDSVIIEIFTIFLINVVT